MMRIANFARTTKADNDAKHFLRVFRRSFGLVRICIARLTLATEDFNMNGSRLNFLTRAS